MIDVHTTKRWPRAALDAVLHGNAARLIARAGASEAMPSEPAKRP